MSSSPQHDPSRSGARQALARRRRRARIAGTLAACAGLWALAGGPARAETKDVFGWIERVTITESSRGVKAKLDTGANTSSMHAENIERFKRGDISMVRFDIVDPDTGELIQMERPLARWVRIREHDGSYQRRPVVLMWLCLGTHRRRVEVNLVDRSQFNYQLLLGRTALRGHAIVDPDQSFTTRPACNLAGMDQ
jgi:hypothetical protein